MTNSDLKMLVDELSVMFYNVQRAPFEGARSVRFRHFVVAIGSKLCSFVASIREVIAQCATLQMRIIRLVDVMRTMRKIAYSNLE